MNQTGKKRKIGPVRRLLTALLCLVLLGCACWLGLVGMVCWKESQVPTYTDYEAIIVLGCQVKPDGTPSVQLAWRLDEACARWQEHRCTIVVCGGQGEDEPRAEGLVMYDYLIDLGVPEEDIRCDSESSNTRQNLRNAVSLLGPDFNGKVLIVTSDYHLPRAIAMAADEGLTASGVGSETLGGWYWVKNRFREALAWVKYWAEKYLQITF